MLCFVSAKGGYLMSTIGTVPGKRLAGLSADLFHKLQSGNITEDELALFVQRKNPFAFKRNEYGHIILLIAGLDLTGKQEVERLIAAGFRVSDWAESCLISAGSDGYDKKHRLIAGQVYNIALMPTKEIHHDADRTTIALRKRGIEKYGYEKPLGGIVPRIREFVSDKQMEEMGFWYIAIPHDPIRDFYDDPLMLRSHRSSDGPWLNAVLDRPGRSWDVHGAFAFIVPAS